MSVPAESIFFDLWASTYDRPGLQYNTYRPVHDAVLARLDGLHPDVVLDLGCGTGLLMARLRERFEGAAVIGADLSDGMLERAMQRSLTDGSGGPDESSGTARGDVSSLFRDAMFVQADAMQLPLADASVDVVVCTESFHWYRDQEAAAAELHRLLRPGGRLIIASIAAITGLADEAIQRASSAVGQPMKAIPKRRLRRLLEGAGFDVQHQGRIARLGFVPWPILTDATK